MADPILYNELGVVAYMQQDYVSAWKQFLIAVDILSGGGLKWILNKKSENIWKEIEIFIGNIFRFYQ